MSAIAKLQAVLGMDARAFKAAMKDATRETSSFQSQIGKVGKLMAGAFSVSAVVGMGRSLATWASDISEAAQNAGVLTSEMMALNQVALKGGLGVEEMRRMLSKLQTELGAAVDGNEQARKKFEDLGFSITDLAGMDPAQMFEKVAQAAIKSGTPLEHLAELFGDRLGPKAVAALRDLAENGLPAVDQAAANAADNVEALGDRWAEAMDKMKAATLALTMATVDGAKQAGAYVQGVAKTMPMSEKLIRAGLAVPTLGMSLIPFGPQHQAGINAAADEQNRQAAELQAASDRRQAERDARTGANKNKAEQTQKRLNQEAYDKLAEQQADGEKTKTARNDKRLSAITKWKEGVQKRYDLRKAFGEKQSALQDKLAGLTVADAGPSQINADALARVGGFYANNRAGFDVASKQIQLDKERNEILAEIRKAAQDFRDAMSRLNGERY